MKPIKGFVCASLAFVSNAVYAQNAINVTEANFSSGVTGIFLDRILTGIPSLMSRIINSSDYQWFATVVFLFSAVMFVTLMVKRYQLQGDVHEVLLGVLKIAVIWVLMQNYLVALMAIKNWQDDFGAMFQFIVMGHTNEFYALETVLNVMDRFEFEFDFSWNIVANFMTLLSDLTYLLVLGVFMGIMAALIIGIAIATLFSTWGFLMVGSVGLFMIPLYLFSPLSWMLDGWVRTLFTVLFYTIFARIVLTISAWGFDLLMTVGAADNAVIVVSGRDWTALLGCIIWGASSMAAVFSIMQYSQAVVSGAGAAMADSKAATKLLSFGR